LGKIDRDRLGELSFLAHGPVIAWLGGDNHYI